MINRKPIQHPLGAGLACAALGFNTIQIQVNENVFEAVLDAIDA